MSRVAKKTRVLFVCMGNICRSPTAEGLFLHLLRGRGRESDFEVDSAGTHNFHVGKRADPRTREAASRRGYELPSRARQFIFPEDFEAFDFIFVADDSNLRILQEWDEGSQFTEKLKKLSDFVSSEEVDEIPDPYYGGEEGFERILDLLEEATEHALDWIDGERAQSV